MCYTTSFLGMFLWTYKYMYTCFSSKLYELLFSKNILQNFIKLNNSTSISQKILLNFRRHNCFQVSVSPFRQTKCQPHTNKSRKWYKHHRDNLFHYIYLSSIIVIYPYTNLYYSLVNIKMIIFSINVYEIVNILIVHLML